MGAPVAVWEVSETMFVDLSLGRQLWVKDRSGFSCAKLLFLWRLKLHLLLHNIIQWSYDFS